MMTPTINALLVSKGHGFDREPFFKMIDALQQSGSNLLGWSKTAGRSAFVYKNLLRS